MTDEVAGLSRRAFNQMGDSLLGDNAVEDMVDFSLTTARDLISSVNDGSISLVEGGRIYTSHATSDRARAVDAAQHQAGNGPCWAAISTSRALLVDLQGEGERWPQFVREALAQGFNTTFSLPLITHNQTLGAMNLYAADVAAFSVDEQEVAIVLAEQASVFLGAGRMLQTAAELSENLKKALVSREIIGVAIGILMERESCPRQTAFDILRRASQRENLKLREVASDIVQRLDERTAADGGRPKEPTS